MKLHCIKCGKPVSTELPEGTVLRAVCECPECIEKGIENIYGAIQPGVYRHYAGHLYNVLFTAQHTERKDEKLVIYLPLYAHPSGGVVPQARPASMWTESVDISKVPSVSRLVPRFKFVGQELPPAPDFCAHEVVDEMIKGMKEAAKSPEVREQIYEFLKKNGYIR